jgi:hypothetical protein
VTETPGRLQGTPAGPLPPDRTQAILEATKEMATRLKAGGHPFALAGSVAAYAHGVVPSFQHDVDFCITRDSAPAVARTLAAAGIPVRRPPEDWLLKARCLGQDIDLIFELAHRPVDREMLARAPVMPVEAMRMPVLTATDLLAAQLRSFSEHHCDFGAALPVARALREKADWALLRREHGAAPMPAAFFYLLERLEIIEPRGDTP